jgi:hypothetical protein
MRLIGLNGLKKSGKDTICEIIKRDYTRPGPEGRVERRAFADKLKIMAALALGFDREEGALIALMDSMKDRSTISVLYGDPETQVPFDRDEAILHDLTGREYLQNFGNHARRVFGDSFWVDQVLPDGSAAFQHVWETVGRNTEGARNTGVLPAIGVITDVRYPNEAFKVLQNGGEVWEVVRPGLVSDGHITEQPLDRALVTQTITNDGTLEDLARTVREDGIAWQLVDAEQVG